MSKDDSLRDLIERVEKATGPDRELDCRIWCALGGGGGAAMFEAGRVFVPDLNQWQAPRYTSSIDAAMTLAAGMPEQQVWAIWQEALKHCSKAEDDLVADLPRYICAASLRAHMGTGG